MNKIISWDEYFMGVAKLSALRSKDPNTQVGCCIVNEEKRIIAVGYNGMPCGCDDSEYPWANREGRLHETKYAYVVHAELNAILNATTPLKNSTLYVTLFPCNECTKAIIQSGIKEIVYEDNKYEGVDFDLAAKKMIQSSNIKIRQFKASPIELK
ncbi:MAG: dCMP deaminase family protein [Erysipelotrichaceae bacterium]|nr:dCMP deaminase family protein [Erysipelotrichaceae bacterium]